MHALKILLLTLGLDSESFRHLNDLRSRYFPPDRNVVPAHVSLFHDLPGGSEPAIRETLEAVAASRGPIPLKFTTMKRLGRGMALTVEAPGLAAVHGQLARAFAPWLTPQDRHPFRPHVTIMNKAEPFQAALAFADLSAYWSPRDGTAEGLLLWEYLGGPWRLVDRFPFAGGSGTMEA